MLVDSGLSLAESNKVRPRTGHLADSEPDAADFGQCCPKVARVQPTSTLMSTNIGSVSTKFGPELSRLGGGQLGRHPENLRTCGGGADPPGGYHEHVWGHAVTIEAPRRAAE